MERCFEEQDKDGKSKAKTKHESNFSKNSHQLESKEEKSVPDTTLNYIGSGALYTSTTTAIRQRNEFKAEINSKGPRIINPRYQQTVERAVKFFIK